MAFQPAILVVGVDEKYKSRVSEALAKHRSAEEDEITEAGVRFYSRKGEPVVVDTTSWNVNNKIDGRKSTETAQVWISRNLLKSLFSKLISVVCVIDLGSIRPNLKYEKSELRRRKYAWLNVLADIFEEFQATITILVKIKGSESVSLNDRKIRIVKHLEQDGFEKRNIIFRRKAPKIGEDPEIPLTPFILTPTEELDIPHLVKVILFGTTGSGKSTLAQMLTLEKLDPCSEVFPSSSCVNRTTVGVKHGQGRGWFVVDTPGLGNLPHKFSSRSTHLLATKVLREIQLTHGMFTHFIYVRKRNRIDRLEEEIWKLFVQIFEDHIKSNFTVVITDSDQGWVETHMDALRENFTGCESFLSADFPNMEPEDKELEEENSKVRMESLKQLERGLAILGRHPVQCDFGNSQITSS